MSTRKALTTTVSVLLLALAVVPGPALADYGRHGGNQHYRHNDGQHRPHHWRGDGHHHRHHRDGYRYPARVLVPRYPSYSAWYAYRDAPRLWDSDLTIIYRGGW